MGTTTDTASLISDVAIVVSFDVSRGFSLGFDSTFSAFAGFSVAKTSVFTGTFVSFVGFPNLRDQKTPDYPKKHKKHTRFGKT